MARGDQTRIRELLSILVGNAGALVLTLATGIISTRFLGPEARGEFSGLLATLLMLSVVLTLGVPQAVVTWKGDVTKLRALLLAQALLSAVVGVLLMGWLILAEETSMGVVGLLSGLMIASGSVAGSVNAGLVQRLGRMSDLFQRVRLLPNVLLLAMMVGLVLAGVGDASVWLLAAGLSGVLVSFPQMIGVLRHLDHKRSSSAGDGRDPETGEQTEAVADLGLADFCRHAMPRWVTALGSQVIYRLDVLAVTFVLGFVAAGYYSVAIASATACFAVGTAAGMQFFSRGRFYDLAGIHSAIRLTLLTSVVVVVPVALLAKPIIWLLYGEEFLEAHAATVLLTLAVIPMCLDYLLVHAALKWDHPRLVLGAQGVGVGLTLVLLAAAVTTDSLAWVASVSIVVYTVTAGLLYLALRAASKAHESQRGVERPEEVGTEQQGSPAPL